jgi:DNA-binding NarL/FixJ family response regulator
LARLLPGGGDVAVIRVVLADDQVIVRTGLARILSAQDGFEVVGQCANGVDALSAVANVQPDVVVMDVRMPQMDGIEATRRLRGRHNAPPVLILTTFDEDETLWGAIEAGACGFVLKDASAPDLLAAVRAVAGGGAWFDPAVAPRVLGAYRSAVAPSRREAARLTLLTDREHDVLRLLARGMLNAEIAKALFVSEATVKSHVGAIFMKLDVRNRAAAIVFAFDHAVVDPNRG